MKCVLPGNNVKVFGRAIHCLSKVGEDLYIEPLENGLALRTVNSSRSAYACFLFSPAFFMQYKADTVVKNNSPDVDEEDEPFRCRITMKSCLAVFKSLSSLEKSVDKCRISLDLKECRLVFQLHCKHGIVKTYNLTYQETETLQAVFSKDLCPNHIVADAKELCDVVTNFQTSQEEVTLSVNPQQVSFKNYVDDEPDPSKVLHTEMFLTPEEFDDYTIGVDTEVTFCLKELRAILAFADGAGLPVSLNFETTGKPIVFSVNGEQNVLESTFVLATLADAPASSQISCSQQSTQRTQTKIINNTSRQNRTQQPSQRKKAAQNNRSTGNKLPNGHASTGAGDRPSTSHASRVTATVGDTSAMDVEFPDDVMLAAGDEAMERLSQQERNSSQTNNDRNNDEDADQETTQEDPISPSPVIPVVSNLRKRLSPEPKTNNYDNQEDNDDMNTSTSSRNRTLLANFENEEEDEDEELVGKQRQEAADTSVVQDLGEPSDNDDYDFIPGTPPSKKFKSMFFGSTQSQSQSQASRQNQNVTVLAEDTDEEDSD